MPRSSRPSLLSLFPAAPNVEQYSAVGSIEEARRRLTQAVRGAEGIGLLIGPPGTGKSMVCCLLAESLRQDFDVVLLADTRLTNRRTLLQNMMFHLNLPFQGLSEGELRLALMDRLTRGSAAAGKEALVLIIDEAQSLPARLLEEVRMINNVVRDGVPRVRTVLAGGVELDDRFAQPQLESLSQRVAARCYLHPLNRDETARYVRDALLRAGADPHALINDDAISAVHHACAGVPRLINQMMRQAVGVAGGGAIDGQTIQQAWAGLQQLASPAVDVRPLRLSGLAVQQSARGADLRATDIVEFAALGEQPLAAPGHRTPLDGQPLSACFEVEVGDGERRRAEADARQSLDETSPEIAAELDRITASLEGLASAAQHETMAAEIDTAAADAWDEQCLPTVAQTTADQSDCCHYVLPTSDAEGRICSLYCGDAIGSVETDVRWEDEVVQPTDSGRDEDRWPSVDQGTNALHGANALQIARLPEDEPRNTVPPRTAGSTSALFGDDFDQEELIPLPLLCPVSRQPAMVDDGEYDPESLLHREIVRIAAEASRVDLIDQAPAPHPRATVPLNRLRSDRRGAQQVGGDIQLSDDSDLLVVEDGIEMGASGAIYSTAAAIETDGTDIDFKTLFSRLRQG